MTGWSPTPSERVSEYVQRILVIEHASVTAPFTLPLYANGTPTLLFQTCKGKIGGQSNHLTLFGQTVFPEALTLSDNFTLIAYFFHPYALYSLFGLSPQELTDNPVDLQLITAVKAKALQEQLLNASTTVAMIDLIDDFVQGLTVRIKTDIALVRFATAAIARDPLRGVEDMAAQDLHLTKRTFMRLFEKQVGILPNQYRRIVQFDAAFRQLQSRRFDKLSDIAFAHGYADQSHFIRAFKEFTTITPKDYEKLMGPRR
ncbi:helix-turn-helix domain-containing protein [Paraflavitalea pollutisoli]|uniref:helix-turn-helix domain-containing protein n=1 Tax=Paraflavitalea pollutisoli TaxID=3034143 RepID=UPI0023EC4153|nr:AraC family transcriptional regulator [Paraflavitalea sp. H1-2-19X]